MEMRQATTLRPWNVRLSRELLLELQYRIVMAEIKIILSVPMCAINPWIYVFHHHRLWQLKTFPLVSLIDIQQKLIFAYPQSEWPESSFRWLVLLPYGLIHCLLRVVYNDPAAAGLVFFYLNKWNARCII